MNDMYLKRKVDYWLNDWKNKDGKNPALIVGIRQCGKSSSIRHFGLKNYKNVVEINFWTNPEYKEIFNDNLDVNTIITNISLRFPYVNISSKDTLLFFDEIQECPKARLSFKSFSIDGRYDVVGSGSYLGINGYILGDSTPVPIGYEDVYHMNTLDFEEFMWANGLLKENISIIEDCFVKKTPVPESVHAFYKELLKKYICIGGFPKPIVNYLRENNLVDGIKSTKEILSGIKADFGRRVDKKGNPLFKPGEVSRIQNAYDLIPTFLAKENKRYVTSKITSGKSIDKNDAIEYLKQAHIVEKVHNLENVSLPLLGNKISSQFKLFPTDIGLLTSMYGYDTIIAILNNNLGQSKGGLYEAVTFESLYKAGIEAFYFAKDTSLEIDFVICYNGCSYLMEAKSKNGNTKSAKTVMKNPNHYGKCKLIKIGDYNVGMNDDIITIPHYLVYMLGKAKEEIK